MSNLDSEQDKQKSLNYYMERLKEGGLDKKTKEGIKNYIKELDPTGKLRQQMKITREPDKPSWFGKNWENLLSAFLLISGSTLLIIWYVKEGYDYVDYETNSSKEKSIDFWILMGFGLGLFILGGLLVLFIITKNKK